MFLGESGPFHLGFFFLVNILFAAYYSTQVREGSNQLCKLGARSFWGQALFCVPVT